MNLFNILDEKFIGENFYCPFYGVVKLKYINKESDSIGFESLVSVFSVNSQGLLKLNDNITNLECVVFPSKDQRDWEIWDKEQKSKVPKTWAELIKYEDIFTEFAEISSSGGKDESKTFTNTLLEKSALALLKIYHLIDVGYGGVVSDLWWGKPNTPKYIITPTLVIEEVFYKCSKSHVTFHNIEQAKEFLGYQENIKLIKDYYMI